MVVTILLLLALLVRWGKVGEIVRSWLVTHPVAGLLAAAARLSR